MGSDLLLEKEAQIHFLVQKSTFWGKNDLFSSLKQRMAISDVSFYIMLLNVYYITDTYILLQMELLDIYALPDFKVWCFPMIAGSLDSD